MHLGTSRHHRHVFRHIVSAIWITLAPSVALITHTYAIYNRSRLVLATLGGLGLVIVILEAVRTCISLCFPVKAGKYTVRSGQVDLHLCSPRKLDFVSLFNPVLAQITCSIYTIGVSTCYQHVEEGGDLSLCRDHAHFHLSNHVLRRRPDFVIV